MFLSFQKDRLCRENAAKLCSRTCTAKMGSHARDHSELFPSHRGRHILPNNPFFTRLLRHAHRGRTAIRDRDLDVVKTYADLLSDALSLREAIRGSLPPETLSKLNRGDEVYIGILAAGGYEFAVAMVAVLAIGAAAVPMSELSIYLRMFSDAC